MNNAKVQQILTDYISFFPNEKSEINIIAEQLQNEHSIVLRQNTFGHVTASGLVVKDGKVALIFHNKLQKYIQPGGHIENDDSLHDAALREVAEETGMSVILHPWHKDNEFIPLNIDVHKIPYNEKKQEPEHYHYDFTYVFATINSDLHLQQEEVSDLKWVPVTSDFGERLLNVAARKIKHLELT